MRDLRYVFAIVVIFCSLLILIWAFIPFELEIRRDINDQPEIDKNSPAFIKCEQIAESRINGMIGAHFVALLFMIFAVIGFKAEKRVKWYG